MAWLLIGIVVFFGIHLLPANPSLREKLVHALGTTPYKIGFATLSFAGLALMVTGMGAAPYTAVWHPPMATAIATAVFMAPALILLAAMSFDNNIKRIARHPMMWGVLLWAASHLLANGTLAAMILFGSFAAYAVFYLCTATPPSPPNETATRVPIKRAPIKRDALAVVIGLLAYSLLVTFHGALFGVAIFF